MIVIRACGLADVLSTAESHSREAVVRLYGLDHDLSPSEYASFAERWRPFRTWAAVMLRAVGSRADGPLTGS